MTDMSGLKSYNRIGKQFSKDRLQIWSGIGDNLLSYEEMNRMNDSADKIKHGFFNKEEVIGQELPIYTKYIPKKTRNKKDIVAAHKRSCKKTNRQLAKSEILNELT